MSSAIAAYSVMQFCELHNISRSMFYELLQSGEAPRCMMIRGRRLISVEEALAWREARTRASNAVDPAAA